MATQDTKIISFEAVHANKQKDGQRLPIDRVVTEMRPIYSRHLTELLQRLFAVIDDELFKRSDKSESVAQQSLYFGAMRQIRVESTSLQSNFHLQIARGYDEFWKRKSQSSFSEPSAGAQLTDGQGFSLLENEALEEEIAISAMIEKGNNLFQNQLYGLNKRMAFLLERDELNFDDNPLSPHILCKAFAEALKSLSSDMTVKLLVYKLFDQVVLSSLGRLYHELNAFLVNEGILPTLARTGRRTPISGAGAYPGSEMHGGADDDTLENQQAYIEVFQGMQRLLDGWRSQMGFPLTSDGFLGGPLLETDDVLSALNVMQSPAGPIIAAPMGTDGLKAYVTDQLLKLQPDESRSLARPEEDIIDMVALIFDFILEDRNLPDPIKGLIARLQIPVVKVAIIEKSFFGRKNHPVRLLLNALAQAGIGLDVTEGVTETPIFKKIESVVTRILDEFDQNVGLFSELLDEFMGFMDKETQRSRIAEERTRQVTQSKEQLHLAKRKIAYEIASRLEDKSTPAAVRSFLFNIWKDVLVLAYLRRDKQPGDWESALEVVDKLIWSVSPPTDPTERKAILQAIPRLLKAIRAGLESISLDPQSVATALKELEACHVARLSKSGPEGAAAGEPHTIEDEENRSVEIRDPELAQAITEIRANLPDIENLTVGDLGRAPDEIGFEGHGSDFIVEDEYLFKARELEVGEWVEFDDGKKRIRGKLSWKSQVTSTYVFVNRKGAKVLEISLSDLAKRMSAKTAQVIEDTGTPLMDRAFGALMSKLKGPVAKPA